MQDPEIAAIDEAMATQNKSRADMARLLGLDSSQVTRIFKGERRVQRHEYAKLAEWLNLAPSAPQPPGSRVVAMPGLIPLFGWAGPADAQLSLDESNARGFVAMHPNQANAKGAFALEVGPIDMIPRYEPGELIYLLPNRWPSRGQDFLLITKEGNGLLRRFVGRDARALSVERLSPPSDEHLPLEEIAEVHAIVGRG